MKIRETVLATLDANGIRHYAAQAEPVIVALETELAEIVESIFEATANLTDDATVTRVLVEAGLIEAAAEAVDEADQSDVAGALNALAAQISGLVSFARRHGYNG